MSVNGREIHRSPLEGAAGDDQERLPKATPGQQRQPEPLQQCHNPIKDATLRVAIKGVITLPDQLEFQELEVENNESTDRVRRGQRMNDGFNY